MYRPQNARHTGDFGTAAEIARPTVEHLFDCGEVLFRGPATRVLAESLLRRGTEQDLQEAQTAIDRLAACPTDTRFVLYELPLLRLRALLARARGDAVSVPRFQGSLPRHGEIAWLRRAYRVGRSDAMTAGIQGGPPTLS